MAVNKNDFRREGWGDVDRKGDFAYKLYRHNMWLKDPNSDEAERFFLEDGEILPKNLSGADLSRAIMIGADLSDTNLSGADLSDTNLSGADLSDAILPDAIMIDANLSGANLSYANLSGANMDGANLDGANLDKASLFDTVLPRVNLSGTDLSGAILSRNDISEANLKNTKINYISLKKGIKTLDYADLRGLRILHNGELLSKDDSRKMAKEIVEERGFKGVKLGMPLYAKYAIASLFAAAAAIGGAKYIEFSDDFNTKSLPPNDNHQECIVINKGTGETINAPCCRITIKNKNSF